MAKGSRSRSRTAVLLSAAAILVAIPTVAVMRWPNTGHVVAARKPGLTVRVPVRMSVEYNKKNRDNPARLRSPHRGGRIPAEAVANQLVASVNVSRDLERIPGRWRSVTSRTPGIWTPAEQTMFACLEDAFSRAKSQTQPSGTQRRLGERCVADHEHPFSRHMHKRENVSAYCLVGEPSQRLRWWENSDGSLLSRRVTVTRLLERFSRIDYIGDSMTAQTCDYTWRLLLSHPGMRCSDRNDKGAYWYQECTHTPSNRTIKQVCHQRSFIKGFASQWRLREMLVQEGGSYTSHSTIPNRLSPERRLVVMNWGLHYGPKAESVVQYKKEVGKMLRDLSTFVVTNPDLVGVWVGSLPQHFNTPRGLFRGNLDALGENKTAALWLDFPVRKPADCQPLEPFIRIGPGMAGYPMYSSKGGEDLARRMGLSNLRFVDPFDMYAPLYDQHGPSSFNHQRWNPDCTHFCYGPGLYLPLLASVLEASG